MFYSLLSKISRKNLRLNLPARQHYGSCSVLRNHGQPAVKSKNTLPPTLRTVGPFQQPVSSKRASFFHSTAPSEKQQENPYHDQIINLTRKKPINFQEIENQLAFIDKETTVELQQDTFFVVVKTCSKMKNHPAAEAAERFVFDWMMNFYEQGRLDKHPKPNIFGIAFQAWVNSGHPSSGKRAEQLLDRMEELINRGALVFDVPNIIYNTVMKAYAIHGDAKNAHGIFDRCKSEFELGNESARPNLFLWSTLIDAHAKSGNPEAWKMAEKLFDAVQQSHKEGVLLEPPNTIIYNTIITVCANCKQPERAEFWLREMFMHHKNGNVSAQPNERSFNAVMDAWAKSNETEEGARKSENVLNDMISFSTESELLVKPDTISYHIVMGAYARVGLPRKAEALLQRQYDDVKAGNKKAELDAQSFNAIIHGWAKAREAISGERSELVLNHMVELHKQGTLKERLDGYTYNGVLNTWAVLGEPDRARLVFERMLEDYKKDNRNAKPTLPTFRALLQAYSNAKLANAGVLADALLEKMEELQLKPSRSAYIAVVRCWRCSLGHDPRAEARVKDLNAKIDKMIK